MFDTYVCVVGTVLNRPERRLVAKTDSIVASFKVATHPRRYDRQTNQWVDAPNLRIKVNCWRRLADNVCSSLIAGDPVVVYGRIASREWKNEQGEPRLSYEMDADSVGHDLSRGVSEFRKTRTEMVTSMVEDEDSANRVNGELTRSMAAVSLRTAGIDGQGMVPGQPGDNGSSIGYGAVGSDEYSTVDSMDTELEALAILRSAGLDPTGLDPVEGPDESTDENPDDDEDMATAARGSDAGGARGRRRGRQPVSG